MEARGQLAPRSHDTLCQSPDHSTVPASGNGRELNGVPQSIKSLEEEEQEKEVWCAICLSVLRQPRQLPCRHAFCLHCLEKMVPKGGAVLRCPNCRRSALLPREGPSALPMDPNLLMVVKKVRERRRIRIRMKKCKVCSGCGELQLCAQCPHCSALCCASCTANHAQALRTQVAAVIKRLEKFKKQLQLESLKEKKRSKESQKLHSSAADEDLRKCRGHKRVLSTLKRALTSCKTFSAPDGERPSLPPAGDVPSSPDHVQIQNLSRQLVFLVKLTSTLENELLQSDVCEMLSGSNGLRCDPARNSVNLDPLSLNDEGANEVAAKLLVDVSSDDDFADMSRSPESSSNKGSLSSSLFRLSRSTMRRQALDPGMKHTRDSNRPQRHQSYHGHADLSNSLRSMDINGELRNNQNCADAKRSRSYSRCGSPRGSTRSHSRTRPEYTGIYHDDDDEDDEEGSRTTMSAQWQTPHAADGADPRICARLLAAMPLADRRQELEDQSLLYRCKPSRSLQRLSHRSLLRRPTDIAWCPWNGMVYVTVSQVAKVVMFSGTKAGLSPTASSRNSRFFDDDAQDVLDCDLDAGGEDSKMQEYRIRAWGERGDAPGQLLFPSAVACSPVVRELYVLDKRRCRVVVYGLTGRYVREFGCRGHGPASFSSAEALAVDRTGLLYLADTCNDRVLVLDGDGKAVREIGNSELRMPAGVAVSGDTLLVADTANHKCRVYHRTTGQLQKTLGSRGINQGQMDSPECVAIDACGFLLVGDTGNNRIQVFRPNGNFVRYLACRNGKAGELGTVTGLSVTSSLEVLAADCSQHLVFVY